MKNKLYLIIAILSVACIYNLFNFDNIILSRLVGLFGLILLIIVTLKKYAYGLMVNTLCLIMYPLLLNQELSKVETPIDHHFVLQFTVIFFMAVVINFFIMAYNIRINISYAKSDHMILDKLYNYLTPFYVYICKHHFVLKVLGLFLQYIALLASIICSFAVLYIYIGKIFSVTKGGQVALWDAIYFSATTFFTIGFGDITPSQYSLLTKIIVVIQALYGHLITTIFWPIVIIFTFNKKAGP